MASVEHQEFYYPRSQQSYGVPHNLPMGGVLVHRPDGGVRLDLPAGVNIDNFLAAGNYVQPGRSQQVYVARERDTTKNRPWNYKIDMCRFFLRGDCKMGDRCSFAHTPNDLRPRFKGKRTTKLIRSPEEYDELIAQGVPLGNTLTEYDSAHMQVRQSRDGGVQMMPPPTTYVEKEEGVAASTWPPTSEEHQAERTKSNSLSVGNVPHNPHESIKAPARKHHQDTHGMYYEQPRMNHKHAVPQPQHKYYGQQQYVPLVNQHMGQMGGYNQVYGGQYASHQHVHNPHLEHGDLYNKYIPQTSAYVRQQNYHNVTSKPHSESVSPTGASGNLGHLAVCGEDPLAESMDSLTLTSSHSNQDLNDAISANLGNHNLPSSGVYSALPQATASRPPRPAQQQPLAPGSGSHPVSPTAQEGDDIWQKPRTEQAYSATSSMESIGSFTSTKLSPPMARKVSPSEPASEYEEASTNNWNGRPSSMPYASPLSRDFAKSSISVPEDDTERDTLLSRRPVSTDERLKVLSSLIEGSADPSATYPSAMANIFPPNGSVTW